MHSYAGSAVRLADVGSVSHADAEAHAKAQYRQFDEHRKAQRAAAYGAEISALKAADRDLPARKPRRIKTSG
jgi:hypothetical protein